jgi:hypothetical protein
MENSNSNGPKVNIGMLNNAAIKTPHASATKGISKPQSGISIHHGLITLLFPPLIGSIMPYFFILASAQDVILRKGEI